MRKQVAACVASKVSTVTQISAGCHAKDPENNHCCGWHEAGSNVT